MYVCLFKLFLYTYVFLIRLLSSSIVFMYITEKKTMNGVQDQKKSRKKVFLNKINAV